MDEKREEIVAKVGAYCRLTFGGDYRAMFANHDLDRDGRIVHGELVQLLAEAEVGTRITRGAWARGVMDAVDADRDGAITWEEFQAVMA